MHKFTIIGIGLGVLVLSGVAFYFYTNQPNLVLGASWVQMPDLQTAPRSILDSGKSFINQETMLVNNTVTNAAHSAQNLVNNGIDKVHTIIGNVPKLLK